MSVNVPLWVRYGSTGLALLGLACTLDSRPDIAPALYVPPERPALSPPQGTPRPTVPEPVLKVMNTLTLESWRLAKVSEGVNDITIKYWPKEDIPHEYGFFRVANPVGVLEYLEPNPKSESKDRFIPGRLLGARYQLTASRNTGAIWESWAIYGAKDSQSNSVEGTYIQVVYRADRYMEYLQDMDKPQTYRWLGPNQAVRIGG